MIDETKVNLIIKINIVLTLNNIQIFKTKFNLKIYKTNYPHNNLYSHYYQKKFNILLNDKSP